MYLRTIIISLCIFSLALVKAMAATIEIDGEQYEYYPSFRIDKTKKVSLDTIPGAAIGLYGRYAVYQESDGLTSSSVLAYIRKNNALKGALVHNTIDYICKSENLACAPLAHTKARVSPLNAEQGMYRAMVYNMNTWIEVYTTLQQSTEVKTFAPLLDTGEQVNR